ncbi:MAG: FmdB family zinc ribbon protein [bacterium]
MPLYDYKCAKCGHIFEVMQKISEDPLKFCPECKGEIKRLISAAGIIFKGSGFHVTDYKKSSKPETTGNKSTKTESKTTETKTTEAKTEKKDDPPVKTTDPPAK